MSGKLNLKKSNILKRLSIPSISEIKYKESLLNALKEKEPEPATNKKIINIKIAMRKSIDHYDNQAKEKKKKIDYHDLEIKLEELENAQKIKDEEILKIIFVYFKIILFNGFKVVELLRIKKLI